MSFHSAAILAIWSVLLLVIGALIPRVVLASRTPRLVPQPLQLDPLDYDRDGPVIDLEPA
ncbi:hypothetical protein A3862_13350 [Methylobacterium sp. XJLW]|jgi:hypothetical protein|uniref:Uncharacterized protein n=1 Tax=Methylobacterium fujisawaense TaxID=107400 RepID=A0ABR6DIG4_9HYPH|nr:hypothetical protein A3862_13350 [Methylobacterium sp. XJLW]MBA9065109.1 hypothetical protein [Methylobacterium fujisawaense]MBP28774.1 hypothetical protein [Methylobacterium sp.]RUP12483.1 MAG: hypothetical protein EKK43_21520 [Methylobacterium sp.]SFU62602.1 hypothetical protein SAMN02799643_01515 [Methylobacterium sp. UNCCL125]